MLKGKTNIKIPLKQSQSRVIMRVVNASPRLVYDFPSAVEYSLGDPEIFKYLQLFWKFCLLPDAPADRGICVREVIILVAAPMAARRILHDPVLPIKGS